MQVALPNPQEALYVRRPLETKYFVYITSSEIATPFYIIDCLF